MRRKTSGKQHEFTFFCSLHKERQCSTDIFHLLLYFMYISWSDMCLMWNTRNTTTTMSVCVEMSDVVVVVVAAFMRKLVKYACHLIRAQKSFFIVIFMDILQLFLSQLIHSHIIWIWMCASTSWVDVNSHFLLSHVFYFMSLWVNFFTLSSSSIVHK
jgi:hypothetical protein